MNISQFNIEAYLLVFARVAGLFIFAPFFKNQTVPLFAKVGIASFLSFFIFSALSPNWVLPESAFETFILLVRETLFGFVLGTLLSALFGGVQAAGQIIGYQMGFNLVSSYNPAFGQMEIIGQIKFLLAFTLFLILNGHLRLIEVLVQSYQVLDIGDIFLSSAIVTKVSQSVGLIFKMAFMIGGPIIVSLWITTVCLGMLVRIIPQMNIFMVDFPLKISVGFISLSICLPYMANQFRLLLGTFFKDMPGVLAAMGR